MSGTVGVISPWLATHLLNHAFKVAAMAQPASLAVGMFTSTTGGGIEVAASGYARQAATFAAAGGSPVVSLNAADIQWPAAAADWGTVVAAGVFDAANNFYGWGNLLGSDGTPITLTVLRADIVKIAAGQLSVGIT